MMSVFVESVPVAGKSAFGAIDRTDEDRCLVERVHGGDVRAFDRLVDKYRKRLYTVIYHLTAHKEDAADLLQDVFVKAFQSLHTLKGESSFYAWIYRIALNTTVTFVKRRGKNVFFSLETMRESPEETVVLDDLANQTNADRGVLRKELQENLNAALQKLSPKHRAVVVLFEIEGLSHTEIAVILKCSEGTVRSRLHYAKEQLKRFLSHYLNHET
jgi:RNA polymerase sigma-70 factor (ECF subfamily)